MITENAVVRRAYIGFEGHGILCWLLTLDFGGNMQSTGARVLEAGACATIAALLRAVGVDGWADLVGKPVRVRRSDAGMIGRITAVGHIVEDRWVELGS